MSEIPCSCLCTCLWISRRFLGVAACWLCTATALNSTYGSASLLEEYGRLFRYAEWDTTLHHECLSCTSSISGCTLSHGLSTSTRATRVFVIEDISSIRRFPLGSCPGSLDRNQLTVLLYCTTSSALPLGPFLCLPTLIALPLSHCLWLTTFVVAFILSPSPSAVFSLRLALTVTFSMPYLTATFSILLSVWSFARYWFLRIFDDISCVLLS